MFNHWIIGACNTNDSCFIPIVYNYARLLFFPRLCNLITNSLSVFHHLLIICVFHAKLIQPKGNDTKQ